MRTEFFNSKIVDSTTLIHFRDEHIVILVSDVSSYGLGAVISHLYPDGTEKGSTVHYFWRDRIRALFNLVQNLFYKLNVNRQLRWSLQIDYSRSEIILRRYTFDIKYRNTKQDCNVDALTPLPMVPDCNFDKSDEACEYVNETCMECLQTFPISHSNIVDAICDDPVLKKALNCIKFE